MGGRRPSRREYFLGRDADHGIAERQAAFQGVVRGHASVLDRVIAFALGPKATTCSRWKRA